MKIEILESLGDILNINNCALLLIDMQKDFFLHDFACHRAGRNVSAGKEVIGNISKLLEEARNVNLFVAHVGYMTLKNGASSSGPWLSQRRRATFSTEQLCVEGSEGAEFIKELEPIENEVVVYHHRYSGFKGTNLDMLLRSNNIKSVITAGASTNSCVESTLRDAFQLDYYVCIPSDGTISWNLNLHNATMENVKHRFGKVTTCDEIINIWRNNI